MGSRPTTIQVSGREHQYVTSWYESHGLGSFAPGSKDPDLYFNISGMRLSITSLYSVKIMSYLGASDIIYSDVIDSFISEILKYKF